MIVLLTSGILNNIATSHVIELACKKGIKVILLHDVGCQFPSVSQIASLPDSVQKVFNSVAVPFIQTYASSCWEKISDKLFNTTTVFSKFMFLLLIFYSLQNKAIGF